jgi:hypothetical protein
MEVYRLESIWLKREQELGYYRSQLPRIEPVCLDRKGVRQPPTNDSN